MFTYSFQGPTGSLLIQSAFELPGSAFEAIYSGQGLVCDSFKSASRSAGQGDIGFAIAATLAQPQDWFTVSWTGDCETKAAMAHAHMVARAGLAPDQGLRGHVYVLFEEKVWERNALVDELAARAEAKAMADAEAVRKAADAMAVKDPD